MQNAEQVDRLLIGLQDSGQTFSRLASDLSSWIDSIDERLANMPGKVRARVERDRNVLHFARVDGWHLAVEVGGGDFRKLAECDMETKIRLAPLIPVLLDEIAATHAQMSRDMEALA